MCRLTSLRTLDLSYCEQLRGPLTPLASLTSLRELSLAGCEQLSGDLTPLVDLTSLRELYLSKYMQLSDLTPLAKLTCLQSLDLSHCLGFRRFAPLQSLLRTLEYLCLFGCKLEDIPPEIVSYAWGDISPNASEEDRQRQEVAERLCRILQQENWKVIRDKDELEYGDQISDFMKMLGQARLVIVVLSEKYLRSPYCMTSCTAFIKTPGRKDKNSLTASFRLCSRTPTSVTGAVAPPTPSTGRVSSRRWSNTLPTLE